MASLITLDSHHHTGIVVKDADATAESYTRKLGPGDWEFVDGGPIRMANGNIGNIRYELLAPVGGQDSLWAAFLAEHGEGLHHLAYNVADVDEAVAKLEEDGGKVVVYNGQPVRIPKWMAYMEIGGPASIIVELLKTR